MHCLTGLLVRQSLRTLLFRSDLYSSEVLLRWNHWAFGDPGVCWGTGEEACFTWNLHHDGQTLA
jgi:hypothetical protein